jgi:hypothetical protein
VAFFVVYEEQSGRRGRALSHNLYVANQSSKTREEAEASQREIAERVARTGAAEPEFRIVEAPNVQDALAQAGSPIPPRIC